MIPAAEVCERAQRSRDPRFDGRFFTVVSTAGIYCRPVCPARRPAEKNVRYYPSAAAAQEAGYRPCLRCRPETARRMPEWSISSDTVIKGLRLIDGGYLNDHSTAELASRLNICVRHMNRLFHAELGATAHMLARVQRLHLAKRLIDESTLGFAEIAMHAGYGSVRRFNTELKTTFGRPPGELRRGRVVSLKGDRSLNLRLPVRLPYNQDWVFGFLRKRTLAGMELVDDLEYRRKLATNPTTGEQSWLSVRWENDALNVSVPGEVRVDLADCLRRVRRLFDLDADSQAVDGQLSRDVLLGPWVAAAPGLRVPGAWDGFETAVRAILGQQVSVARATVLAAKLIDRYGNGSFPGPERLAAGTPAEIGMPGNRGRAISALAAAVAGRRLVLDESVDNAQLQSDLCAIPGIGPWTAAYAGMRIAKDPDAFPESDWVVLKMLDATPAQVRRRARDWSPWRAYAVMYLWWGADQKRRAQVLSATGGSGKRRL
ncbi:MAG: helix-turn-helix domain-containing protein [Gammaproteobacteria bacterium]|nr:helix-turn-helix domain-containing protein [Gammaproteobacteria bacterium]